MADDKKDGNLSPEAVPEALKTFVGADGKLDIAKVAQSMTEAQQKVTDATQESVAARQAYETLLATAGNPSAAASPNAAAKVPGRDAPLTADQLVTNPTEAIDSRIDKKVQPTARAIVEALLAVEHPELARDEEGKYADPKFVDGLLKYAGTLPPTTRAAMAQGDYATAAHVIRTFKALQKKAADAVATNTDTTRERPNFSESGKSASVRTPGKIWTRSEIREMVVKRPDEYRKNEAEINKAYSEDRVDFSK